MEQVNSEVDSFFSALTEEEPTDNNASCDSISIKEQNRQRIINEAIAEQNNLLHNASEIYTRFSDEIPVSLLHSKSVVIVGGGGLGNSQWKPLLAMGFTNLTIIDDQTIEPVNVGSQMHNIDDVGEYKVDAIQAEAMRFCHASVATIKERVLSLQELYAKVGFIPDVIIGCTDSADFRNSIISGLKELILAGRYIDLPELFMDYRMTLGDWTGYFIPCRMMAYHATGVFNERVLSKYVDDAVFPETVAEAQGTEEDAGESTREGTRPFVRVAEPMSCTRKGIAYTPLHVAAYTGAYLQWFYTEAYDNMTLDMERNGKVRDFLTDYFFSLKLGRSWKVSYSAKDSEPITFTRREQDLWDSRETLSNQVEWLKQYIAKSFQGRLVSRSRIKRGDIIVYFHYGDVIVGMIFDIAEDGTVSFTTIGPASNYVYYLNSDEQEEGSAFYITSEDLYKRYQLLHYISTVDPEEFSKIILEVNGVQYESCNDFRSYPLCVWSNSRSKQVMTIFKDTPSIPYKVIPKKTEEIPLKDPEHTLTWDDINVGMVIKVQGCSHKIYVCEKLGTGINCLFIGEDNIMEPSENKFTLAKETLDSRKVVCILES